MRPPDRQRPVADRRYRGGVRDDDRHPLRRARDAAGLSRAQLADLVGVTSSRITGWETRGKQVPGFALADLCEALGVTPEWVRRVAPVNDDAPDAGGRQPARSKLGRLREEAGLTRGEVAAWLGEPLRRFQMYERDKQALPVAAVPLLARRYATSEAEIEAAVEQVNRRRTTPYTLAEDTPLGKMRTAAGYSLSEIADALDVYVATVGDWERGLADPTSAQIAELATLYGTTPETVAGALIEARADRDAGRRDGPGVEVSLGPKAARPPVGPADVRSWIPVAQSRPAAMCRDGGDSHDFAVGPAHAVCNRCLLVVRLDDEAAAQD